MKLFQYKRMIWGTKNGPFLTWEVISIWLIFIKTLPSFITLISSRITPCSWYPCKTWSTQWFVVLIYIIIPTRKLFPSIHNLFALQNSNVPRNWIILWDKTKKETRLKISIFKRERRFFKWKIQRKYWLQVQVKFIISVKVIFRIKV